MSEDGRLPRWIREIARLLPIKSQVYLYGNVKDTLLYPAEDGWQLGSLKEALFSLLQVSGYSIIGAYDAIDGMSFADSPGSEAMAGLYDDILQAAKKEQPKMPAAVPVGRRPEDPLNNVLQQIRQCLTNRQHPCAFILEYTSQLIQGPAALSEDERLAFLRLLKAGQESRRITPSGKSRPLQNIVFIVSDRITDLPPWLYLDNPFGGNVEIERPRKPDRERFFSLYLAGNSAFDADELIDLTEGMAYRDLIGIRGLANQQESVSSARALVELYRFGIKESQWETLKLEHLANAEEALSSRVLGQPAAVSAVCDVLRRARLHLSGAQHSGRSKPRGVLFFAGPTGVGKTELAKATASLIFGSDDACIRFDMSEYGLQHSDQRLLGAPPGYVGYEEGGQLTNRLRANPFSVLLFDEIEKAHPSILDKFLQILEDGRMTDGRGETVYFGESLIVFTSNVGIYQLDQLTGRPAVNPSTGQPILNVDPTRDRDYGEIRDKVTSGVQAYFKHFLGRPELLNRIGRNIVVFDYVRPPIMRMILEQKVLPGIKSQILERWKLEVVFSEDVVDLLLSAAAADVSSGGRGIGNLAEVAVLNPVSRRVFELVAEGSEIEGGRLLVNRIIVPEEAGSFRYEIESEFCHAS